MQFLLSTGAFVGRVNGRNHALLTEHHSEFDCDGFEFMIFPEFYNNSEPVIESYRSANLNIPVMHFDKEIGGDIGSESKEDYAHGLRLLLNDLNTAMRLGTKKAVIHLWGRKDSDKYTDLIYSRAGEVRDICLDNGVVPVFENIFCCVSSPLIHLENLAERYPDICFTIDSRPAQFHGELEKTLKSHVMKNVSHIHINDYAGGYLEWDKINPIPQPLNGNVDWDNFFSSLKSIGFDGTVTLEAPAHLPIGVDSETLNRSLRFIKNNLK